jgi:hypothetical protein
MNILEKILGGVAAPVVGYFQRRMELKSEERQQDQAIKAAIHERQVQLIREGLAADATWEIESIRAHTSGWKDEAVLIMFMLPFVLCFFPNTANYVREGFGAISATPVWYQIGAMSVFLATYGIRWWRRTQSDT